MHPIQKIKQFLLLNTSPKQTVVKNTFWLLLGDWLYKFIQAVLIFSLAFIIGKEQFGIYSYITSITWILLLVVDFNLTQTSIRSLHQWFLSEQQTIQNSMLLKIFLSAGAFFWLLMTSFFLSSDTLFLVMLLSYFFYLLLANTTTYLRSTYRYHELMEKEVLFKAVSWFILLCIWWASLFIRKSLSLFIYSLLFVWVVDLTITCIYLPSFIFSQFRKKTNLLTVRSVAKYGFPLALSSFLINIYISADQVILWAYGQLSWLGIYAFAYKITFLYTLFSSAFFNALFPVSTLRITTKNSRSVFLIWLKKVVKRNSLLIVLLLISTHLLQHFWWTLLWEYTDILWVLKILWLYCFLEPIGHRWYTVLVSIKKDQLNTVFLAIAAGINILGNILYIPTYWYIAAARVTVASYLLYSFLCFLSLYSWTYQTSKE